MFFEHPRNGNGIKDSDHFGTRNQNPKPRNQESNIFTMKKIKLAIFMFAALLLLNQCKLQTGPGVTQSADGLEIHYTIYGTGDTAIVLIHGWMCDQTSIF